MPTLAEHIASRRTFAIISHPDAGKTTLTEKLLLYSGSIQTAGSVKGKASSKHAVSDWMDIEKERGISVTSSVLQFEHDGCCVNILDTPGHQDFSEDTYRTLMAADAAVMVIDAAKGVEAQTKKLFKVCTLRHIPIFTFVNKMDRESRDPFELMEEIETVLGIGTYPMNWPIGNGRTFRGVFDRQTRNVIAFDGEGRGNSTKKVAEIEAELGDAALDELIGSDNHQNLMDDIELLDGAADEFDLDAVRAGKLSPVFFGSALTNFGVEPFLKDFLRQLVHALDELLAFQRVDLRDSREMLRRERGDGRELHMFSLAHRVADAEDAGIEQAHDVAGVRLVHRCTVVGHERRARCQLQLLAALHVERLHAALELARADAHERDAVAVVLVHVRLDLEHEACEFLTLRVN